MKVPPIHDIIIEETDDYVVLNKPPHIASLNDRVMDYDIQSLVKQYDSNLTLCHRLDKETSGVIVAAKHEEFYRHMAMQFEHREVEKEYFAVVNGVHDIHDLWVEQPLGELKGGRVRIDPGGKPSLTWFDLGKAYTKYSLLRCKPVSGRAHQIRVHLASIGAPIAGDETYGGDYIYLSSLKKNYNIGKFDVEKPLMSRLALHAYSIIFQDMSGNDVKYEAPYPKDFAVLIKQLEKYAS